MFCCCFISLYFLLNVVPGILNKKVNPARPHTWLTALSLNPKRSKQALSLCEVQNLHTILLWWILVQLEVLVVWYEFQVRPGFDKLVLNY